MAQEKDDKSRSSDGRGQPTSRGSSQLPRQAGGHDRGSEETAGEVLARQPPWALCLLLLGAVMLAYQPAWKGEPVWDDNAHITRPELRSLEGLKRIWFDLGQTQQYYPLTHSAFWLQYKLWGESTFGYHLVNIALHVLSAVLFALVLRRLGVPGALLAAAIFALHPVHVESVAWITELKNTLSGAFYLGAALAYLSFDQSRRPERYALALGLFVLGLLSKTVVATLPAALLVVFWWKRGRLSWRRDVLPLIPLFVLGVAGGLFTAWVERKFIGAGGEEFTFSWIERCLIAGRAIWFYLGKLFWPANLTFIYSRWKISQAVWWQYIFPVAAIALLFVLIVLRRRSRAPLAAMLFFVGTLFPVLGFFNVFPFRYSFVADHFQYLPSLGVIALVSAAAVWLARRLGPYEVPATYALSGVLLVVFGVLCWRQSGIYRNEEYLYLKTLERNRECWMAYNNLADLWLADNPGDSVAFYRKALEIKPDYVPAHHRLGTALERLGKPDEAIEHYRLAVKYQPDYAPAHYHLGLALANQGPDKLDEAVKHLRLAVAAYPDYFDAHNNLRLLLMHQGRLEESLKHLREAIRIRSDYVPGRATLAMMLATEPSLAGRHTAEAIGQAEEACRLSGWKNPFALDALAAAYADAGRFEEACETAEKALSLAKAEPQLAGYVLEFEARLDLYKAEKPYRRPVTAPSTKPTSP